jgi:hypothetical protein
VSDDLAEIRRIVTDTATELRLHDGKVDSNVARIAESQERTVAAIERISDATLAIKTLAEQMKINGKKQNGSLPLDRRTIAFAMLVLVIAAVAAGGGAELIREVLGALRK